MNLAPSSADDRLVERLLSPPDLADGIESLRYWRERRRRLPWYRMSARREATRMTVRWERRLTAALVAQRGVPIADRLNAGLLVAHTRLRRGTRRVAIGLAAGVTVGLALAATAFAATVIVVLHSM